MLESAGNAILLPSQTNADTTMQIAFWRFDDTGAVLYYDATLPNLNKYYNLASGVLPSAQFNAARIEQLCDSAQQLCTGSNIQYNSTQACINTLSHRPFGEWDEIWGDNVVCRTLHIQLAQLRPDVSFDCIVAC